MWWLHVRLGTLDLEMTKADAEDDTEPALPVLVDLRVTDELDNDAQGWPRPQGPSTAAMTLLMDSATEAAATVPGGAEVAVEFYREPDIVNQVRNPGTEVDTQYTYRLGSAAGAITRDTTRDHNTFTGTASARVAITSTGSLGTYYGLQNTAVEGDTVRGGVWVRPETEATFRPYLWGPMPSTGANAAIEPTDQDTVCPAGVWTFVPCHVTVPFDRTVSRAGVRHVGNAPAVGFAYNTDDAVFAFNVPENLPVESFNGNGDQVWPVDGYTYTWDGTPHQSSSTRHARVVGSFYGRASDPVIKPHDRGVMVQVTCSDYTADLGAETVGSADRPEQRTNARLDAENIDGELGLSYPSPVSPGPDPSYWSLLVARSGAATDLLSWLQELLASSVFMEAHRNTADWIWRFRPHVYELRPNIDTTAGALDATEPWLLAELDPLVLVAPTGSLENVGGVYRATFPEEGQGIIPAGATDFDATWARRAAGDINTVDVVWNSGNNVQRVTSWTPGTARVTDRRETQLADVDDAETLGQVYLPDNDDIAGSAWEAERFTVFADLAPAGWWPGDLREVALLSGLQERHNPDGRPWWAGVVAFREWRIVDGQATVDVGLIAQPMETDYGALTIDAATGPTLDTIDPALTINEMALLLDPE